MDGVALGWGGGGKVAYIQKSIMDKQGARDVNEQSI